jgi:hypothetical protein
VASKFAWISGKRGFFLAIAVVAFALVGGCFGHFGPIGLWDGPH